ncbi:MarR family winged helix-turn-helix transcriptional regulator [Microbacterium sp. ARD32]|uniref:MarR family winged helix-turn-helix transcriptional regulator n=1 Tax=Microbacterium sp. ARD32 TaxID=2962577 RepID=UPI002882C8A7|nr:MarR family winged helix-turn-helix transcriptional regulator [Microbacterium sp. ARD32]MDT0157937.1 MarR family winged helix-turn-helix transcriptional regulator [Microbacterium sp. ARD32]
MTDSPHDAADAIAAALFRLRGRRGAGPHGHQHPHGRGPHGPHGRRGMGPWAADRSGAPAVIRMLEALATASAPLGVSDLAAAVGVDQPRASRLVQQGVDRGWVRREADPDDARRTRIALTDDGARTFRGMRGERREALARALAAFTDDESAELARLLTKLADNWGA